MFETDQMREHEQRPDLVREASRLNGSRTGGWWPAPRTQRVGRLHRAIVAIALLTLAIGPQALAVPRSPALAEAPTPVTLVLQGLHPDDGDYHLGTFTAPPPLCSSGSWRGNGRGGRVFSCADGSGTFTASFDGEQEHFSGHGPWKISEGSGSYVTLRGHGTGSNVLLSSDPITFTNTWQGVVDMDATPPKISLSAASATRVRGSKSNYGIQVAFKAQDDVADNPVQYAVAVTDSLGRQVARRTGTVGAGPAPVALKIAVKIRPPANAKTATVEVWASDPIGNQRTVDRTIKLPPPPKTR